MFSIQEKQSKELAACQSNHFSSHKEIDSWWVSSQIQVSQWNVLQDEVIF